MSRDDDPEFLPPRPSDLPEPVERAPEPQPVPGPYAPAGPPLPADQPGAHDSGSRAGVVLKVSLFIAAPVLVIAIVAVAVVGVRHLGSSLKPHFGGLGGTSPSPTGPAATTDPPKPTPSATTPPTKPVVAGWQPVVHVKRGVAYDVPRDWEVNSAGTIVGFEDIGASKQRVLMSGSAEYGSGYCTNSDSGVWRAVSGVAAAPTSGDLAAQARAFARLWGQVYDEPAKNIHAVSEPGHPKPVRVKGAHAYHVRVKITVTGGDACTPHRARVDILTIRGPHTNGAFILATDQGASADPTTRTIDHILKSVRVYKP